jgi:predicted RNase H-like nuclease
MTSDERAGADAALEAARRLSRAAAAVERRLVEAAGGPWPGGEVPGAVPAEVRAALRDAAEALAAVEQAVADRHPAASGSVTTTSRVAEGGAALPAVEVTVPVLGVDGCKAGWVGAVLEPGAPRPRVVVAATIGALVETVRLSTGLRVVAVDMPIGLPDRSTRQADALARRALPGKASTVFSTLTREAYAAASRAEADVVNRLRCGQGVGAQAFALHAKVREVDEWLRSRPTVEVVEAHPELSFATMVGAPLLPNKKTPEGRAARLAALRAGGLASPSILEGSGYAADDVLDACAVAWTAVRHAAGDSVSRPDPPEVFSDGLPAAIRT